MEEDEDAIDMLEDICEWLDDNSDEVNRGIVKTFLFRSIINWIIFVWYSSMYNSNSVTFMENPVI